MGLITLNLKRVLNWNFIFMSAVAAIFGMISLMNFGDISENIVFGVDIKYFMLDGYLCLFIFFAGEISKDMLQQEKITKRIEWKLANGIKISSIVKENLLSLWIGTLILLFPLLLMISIRLPNLILLLSTYFLILSILYSAFINVLILWIRNMNWFKSIPIFATLLHILLVGFMGAEASVYAYQEGATDPVVNFAQLTQRAGNFLVAREEMPDFKWEDLKGEKVLGGRKGGMPEMVFEYILKKNGIDPQKDLTIDQSVDFGSTAAAFTSDDSAAYTVEFEPSATILEKEGAGYVVASLGEASGYVPYTSYSAKASYMKENPEIIQKFTDALQKGMDYVQSHTPEEIAEVIAPQFKETDLETITAIVKRYYDQDTWKENLIFEKDSFELLQDILEDAGELTDRTAYENLVQTEYAQKACEN